VRAVETVVLEERFQGFTDGALGGYAAGMLARSIDGPAEVNLRSLPPIGRELELREAGGSLELLDGETLVAEGSAAELELQLPEPPELEAAEAAGERLVHEEGRHLYPGCFACGPDRAPGDGLRLFMGRVPGRDDLIASAWTPHPDLADGELLPVEMLWGALDCPTIWADWSTEVPVRIPTDHFTVLARQRLEARAPIRLGEPVIVSAWPIGQDGRKHLAGAAVHDPAGALLARAESLLIEAPGR
jgi:hypothetical protein